MMDIFNRTRLLVGNELMQAISSSRVIVFGIGGVGSWCAESLIRSGIENLTIVDPDKVTESNINRQLMATTSTVGELKVEAFKKRLLDINPKAIIETRQEAFSETTEESFELSTYDYVVDAIDSLRDKTLLITKACEASTTLFSSMGAAMKIDPTRIAVDEFWKVKGCPLGATLRRRFRALGIKPAKKFLCVYSPELLHNHGTTQETCDYKICINGSLPHITGIFGLTLAGLIMQDICQLQER